MCKELKKALQDKISPVFEVCITVLDEIALEIKIIPPIGTYQYTSTYGLYWYNTKPMTDEDFVEREIEKFTHQATLYYTGLLDLIRLYGEGKTSITECKQMLRILQ